MPQLWAETVEAHRAEVREAILNAAGDLLRRRGLLGVTMSDLAAAAGIGRATLYKYFPDVEQVVTSWHERQVAAHLAELAAIREQPGDSVQRLRAVSLAYGRICQQRQQHGDAELRAALHRHRPAGDRPDQLVAIFADLIVEAAASGAVRGDVPPDELAAYCISALEAASAATTPAALMRLVDLVWAGLTRPA
ncbi:MAG TPA: TetR/AcrR family transcriptional regulator [Propionibacteriaceae bacterium]|jgi:AcrR family transcriptional regulator|nr:TetR/AcrR family transcriptional regulator [Propionibacteriaceae bacterium]